MTLLDEGVRIALFEPGFRHWNEPHLTGYTDLVS
jgi:hypothetical protein